MSSNPSDNLLLNDKVTGVIPARLGSTRFQAKPLALILGREMILWVIDAALKSKTLDQILVATDDEKIKSVVEKNFTSDSKVSVVMTAPDCPSGTDRVWQAVNLRALSHGQPLPEFVVNIQGDEPLLEAEAVDQLVAAMRKDPSSQMSTLAHELKASDVDDLNIVKVLVNENQDSVYFSRLPIPFSRVKPSNVSEQKLVFKHVGIYGFRTPFLRRFCEHPVTQMEQFESLEQLRALSMGVQLKVVVTPYESLGVDVKEDVQKVENALKLRQK